MSSLTRNVASSPYPRRRTSALPSPNCAATGYPRFGDTQRLSVKATDTNAPPLFRRYETTRFQQLHVLERCRERHGERRRQLRYGCCAARQTANYESPIFVCERVEHLVEI